MGERLAKAQILISEEAQRASNKTKSLLSQTSNLTSVYEHLTSSFRITE